ncbi:hypothetical protein BREVNS_1457 [Brevinematales bacterium NS]|nr:hypothetical protein BREVNS_1457 [Brevinematales bacterium NS]
MSFPPFFHPNRPSFWKKHHFLSGFPFFLQREKPLDRENTNSFLSVANNFFDFNEIEISEDKGKVTQWKKAS